MKPVADRLSKTGSALMKLVGEDEAERVRELVDDLLSRFDTVKNVIRQRANRLDDALQQMSEVRARLSLSVCLSVCLAGCLAAWLPGCLPGCLADCLAGWLPCCLTVWLSVCLYGCLAGCLAGCVTCLAYWFTAGLVRFIEAFCHHASDLRFTQHCMPSVG